MKKFFDIMRVWAGRQFELFVEYRDKNGNDQTIRLYIDTTNPERLKSIIESKRKQHAPVSLHNTYEVK
jgi:hypothetical protein